MHLRRLGIVIPAAAIVAACGGVDRGGSRDGIVEAMRNQGVEADVQCIGDVLDGYSDHDLKRIDDQLGQPVSTDPQTLQFIEALKGCEITTPTTAAP